MGQNSLAKRNKGSILHPGKKIGQMGDDLALAAFESLSLSREEEHLETSEYGDDEGNTGDTNAPTESTYSRVIRAFIHVQDVYVSLRIEEIAPEFISWLHASKGFQTERVVLSATTDPKQTTVETANPAKTFVCFGSRKCPQIAFARFPKSEDAEEFASCIASTMKDVGAKYLSLLKDVTHDISV